MRRTILGAAGLVFGVWLTWLAFRGTDWAAVTAIVRDSSIAWLILSALFFLAAHVVRSYRWNIILKTAIPNVPFRHVFAAMMIGALAQLSLPLKAGLFFRSIAFARITGTNVSRCYGTATLDRVPELVTLGFCVIGAMFTLPAVDTFVIAADVFATKEPIEFSGTFMRSVVVLITGAVTIRLGLLIALYLKQDVVIAWVGRVISRFHEGSSARIQELLRQFADALHVMGSRREVLLCLGWTFVFWFMFMAGHAATFQAIGIEWDWRAPLFSVLLTAVSMALPGAPGFVGGWHLAVVTALVITTPGLESAAMKAAAIMTHVIGISVAASLGVGALASEHMGVAQLAKDASAMSEE